MPRFHYPPIRQVPAVPYSQCVAKTTADGKPGLSVEAHCRIVWAVARVLLEFLPVGLRKAIQDSALPAAALHDVGKVSPGFQLKYFRGMLSETCPRLAKLHLTAFETNHATIGQAAVNAFFGVKSQHLPLALAVGAHHGRLDSDTPLKDDVEKCGGHSWASQRKDLIKALFSSCGLSLHSRFPTKLWPVIAGLVTTADWIGSDESFFPSHLEVPDCETLLDVARKAVKGCGWFKPLPRPGLNFEHVFGFRPHPAQEAFYSRVDTPGLYILEAPMGYGKTEAALFAAYRLMSGGHNTGIYFGLPTRLTSDKIHQRVATFLEKVLADSFSLQLAHGNAWLRHFIHGRANEDEGGPWFTPRKRNLLCPFAVGTIDQALLSAMRVKHFFVRAFGLAGKVVILDEVHSYDGYTGTLMEHMVGHLLNWGCTVIVLSATLTKQRRLELVRTTWPGQDTGPAPDSYPLVSVVKANEPPAFVPAAPPASRSYQIHLVDLSPAMLARQAAGRARQGQCVVCIANTVARAQAWYDALAAERREGEFEIGLLHSRFPAFARSKLEAYWIDLLGKGGKRPQGCVLVATQVVEQSVDIDADVLFSELAPTDMLLQRMGRQWRHLRPERPCSRPETFILAADLQKATGLDEAIEALGRENCLVYAPYLLWRTYQVFAERSRIDLSADVRHLLEQTYGPADGQPDFAKKMHRRLEEHRCKLASHALAGLAEIDSLPALDDDESLATRYSDLHMVSVLLVTAVEHQGPQVAVGLLDGSRVIIRPGARQWQVMGSLHVNLLSMPAYRLARLGALQTPSWLKGLFYETVPVLEWSQADGRVLFCGRPTGYTYDHVRGLRWQPEKRIPDAPHLQEEELGGLDVFDKQRFQW